MKTGLILGSLALAAFAPLASAEDVGGVCPSYNPYAVTNLCANTGYDTATLYGPDPSLTGPYQLCILGPYCVPYPWVTLDWVPVASAPIVYSYGFVEATALCNPIWASSAEIVDSRLPCRVDYDTRTLLASETTPLLA